MNRNTRRLALVVLLLLAVVVFAACQRERPAAEQEGWTTPAAGPAVSPDAMDAVSPAVTAVITGTVLPAPSGFVTGTLPTPVAPATLATPTPAAAVLQVGATYGYVVKAGDTLFSIALANNTDVETIRRLNNLPDDTIQVGQVLIVPGTGEPAAQASQDDSAPDAQATPASPVVYTVAAGDNLSGIAAQFNVTWQEVAAANNIPAPYTIYRGQKLVIPGVQPTPEPTAAVRKHVVQPGETLLGIAVQYDTTTEAIMQANNLSDANFLRVGQELVIPE
jgi:LysM repeat protein